MDKQLQELLKESLNLYLQENSEVEKSLISVPNLDLTSQKLAEYNPNRVEIWITNSGDRDLYLGPFEEVNQDLWSVALAPNDTLIINAQNFRRMLKSEIFGVWDDLVAQGAKAMISEFTIKC
ncbi:hypothetical protein [Gracilimonas sediminicola]|uniref:hypothetical protein n=1 Tax=Gracilimonas sediminicola TaxID=2952158 RepID=UPI0038D46693